MDRIVVRGRARLAGEVRVSGSKNSTLALMAAALLVDGAAQSSLIFRRHESSLMQRGQ